MLTESDQENREKYYAGLRKNFLTFGPPETADIVMAILRTRDQILDSGLLVPYYPKGAKRFKKFSRPEEHGNPFGGILFPHDMSDEDRIEAIEYLGKNPDHIPWGSLGTRAEIIRACRATGMDVPQEILNSGCGDPLCSHCG